jgi:hypothetical protein
VLVVLDGAEPGTIPISCPALELSCGDGWAIHLDYVLARVHGDESKFLARLLGAIDGTVEGSVGYTDHCSTAPHKYRDRPRDSASLGGSPGYQRYQKISRMLRQVCESQFLA